jgi:hypothetical protein
MKRCVAVVVFIASLAGCKLQIPNRVSPDEYSIYSDWMNSYFSKRAPSRLYLATRTFAFPPESSGCTNEKIQKAGVPLSLINPLRELGDAEYQLEFDYPEKKIHILWRYTVADDWGLIPQKPEYKWIEFSRVSFNHARDKALFGISDSCGGLCGSGHTVYAHKNNGAWVFENAGCSWVY